MASEVVDLRGRTLTAPWVWLDGCFRQGVRIRVDENGKIDWIGTVESEQYRKGGDGGHDEYQLKDMALLPGFINAHSHAFHRCLRGRSQIGGQGADTFWAWRQDMYALVADVTFERMKRICADTFREMLSAGITTVGEFHYVHHESVDPSGQFALDMAVVEAALCVGIRLVLIVTLYLRSGFGASSLQPDQWRFGAPSVDTFCAHVESLNDKIRQRDPAGTVSLALAVHSLRAVPTTDARQLVQFAFAHRLPLHIHLEEQPAELEQCKEADQRHREPSEVLLEDVLPPAPATLDLLTLVHCTFTKRASLDSLASRGAHICLCPCTEGFLGDGVPELEARDRLCVGTDCNNRIAPLEELRWMVFCQNMRKNCRNWAALNAHKLLDIGTRNGASSLGLSGIVGEFRIGQKMDFVAFDCNSPCLTPFIDGAGEQLADAIVFGAGNAEVAKSAVDGVIRYERGEQRERSSEEKKEERVNKS